MKEQLFKTARTTIACAAFPADVVVGIEHSHQGTNGVHWYQINSTEKGKLESPVMYPAHHLTNFVL